MGSAGQPTGELGTHPADHLHLPGGNSGGDLPGWMQGSSVQATDRSSGAAKGTRRHKALGGLGSSSANNKTSRGR
jgi:hypothetical protein